MSGPACALWEHLITCLTNHSFNFSPIVFPPKRIPPLGPPKRSSRQRVLAAWRGIDLSAAETARADRVRPAGSVMPRVLTDLRMDSRRAEAEIVKVWNSLLDPNIVAHAQPVGLRKGTLFVNVDRK